VRYSILDSPDPITALLGKPSSVVHDFFSVAHIPCAIEDTRQIFIYVALIYMRQRILKLLWRTRKSCAIENFCDAPSDGAPPIFFNLKNGS
jgi:hypothetical protein